MISKMLNNFKLRTHIMISIGTVVFLAFVVTIGVVIVRTNNLAEAETIGKSVEMANRYANSIKAELEVGMAAVLTLAQAFEGIKTSGTMPDRQVMNEMIKRVLTDNPSFVGMSSGWEPDALDEKDKEFVNTKGHDATGRFIPYWYRADGKIDIAPLEGYDTEGLNDWYIIPKRTGMEAVTEPYLYPVGDREVLMTTLTAPIKHDGRFVGIVTADIDLLVLHKLVSDIKIFETGYICIISNNGLYVAHPKAERLGKSIQETGKWASPNIDAIKSGKGFIVKSFSNTLGKDVTRICVPIQIGRTKTPWAVLVNVPQNKVLANARSIMYSIVIISAVSLLALMVVIFIMTRSITTPLIKGVNFAQGMSEGDFTQKLDVDQKDEIGTLANVLNSMTTNLGVLFRDVKEGVETLSASSKELSAISQDMAENSEDTSGKSDKVHNAALEMNSSMNSIAAASEEALGNLNLVAAATEEMTATISEIAQNTETASGITGNAVEQAKNASKRMNELSNAAMEIGKVTGVITDISEQTNLLALNATIEAARAGEAGKGFAVVAGEIKDLAKQTADATSKIKKEIENVQATISATIGEIKQISDVNNNVNDIVSSIATAVDEQSVTTKEVSENIAQASQGFTNVNENVMQSATVSQNVTQDISGIKQSTGEISNSTSQVNLSAQNLSQLANQLSENVKKFKC